MSYGVDYSNQQTNTTENISSPTLSADDNENENEAPAYLYIFQIPDNKLGCDFRWLDRAIRLTIFITNLFDIDVITTD